MLKSRTAKTFLNNSLVYFKFFLLEYLAFLNYVNAIIIGLIVNYLMGQNIPGKPAPYIIPIIVQAISKSMIKYKNRHMERLLQLPSEWEDPVFIMKENGDIILSTGLTLQKFKEHNIANISMIIGKDGFEYLSNSFFDDDMGNQQTRQVEVFSELFSSWYEIKIKCIFSKFTRFNKEYLIWFNNITELKNQSKRMSDMLAFSDDIMTSLPIMLENYVKDEIFLKIAEFIFSIGYNAVFISMQNKDEQERGMVLTFNEDKIEKSDSFIITNSAMVSTELNNNSFILADISGYASSEEFTRKYLFDDKITAFVNSPINNFIYYKLSNVLIIGFNKKEFIPDNEKMLNDRMLIKIVAMNLRTFLNLQDYISSYFLNYLKTLNEEF
ncbi:MAG: hypothetical protein V1874_16570 [Spirochaetota bacterium]